MPTAYLSHDYQLIKHSKKISDGPRQPGATTKYDTEGSFSSKSSLSFQSQVSYPGGYVNYEVTGIKTSK
ncbi:MAG: hypothetical protein K0S32_1169 [Bacteroidetes bacterium]|nr:hypothetical protein [Bacteroidota bacterium]